MRNRLSYIGLVLLVGTVGAQCAFAADLVVTPTSLFFAASQGTNAQPQVFYTYPSASVTTFNPTLTANVSWIMLSTANAGSVPNSIQVTVQVNSQAMAPGIYGGQVTVTQAGFTKSPQVVSVSL